MNEDRKKEPSERFNTIMSAGNDEDESTPKPQSKPESNPQSKSPLDQLPRAKKSVEPPKPAPKAAEQTPSSSPVLPKREKHIPPEQELPPRAVTHEMPRREKYLRALWTLTSVISMIVNIVVIVVVVVMLWAYRDIRLPEGVDITMVNKLLSGLYSNFEKLDRASIITDITVDDQIPLDITVPVRTTTQITLSESVSIPDAQVVINTGGLNINSTARVTLPAGTPLTVNLDFVLPVQDTVPVQLTVPVNIPMAETELHDPFVGLQEVVKPLYCLVEPAAASSISGEPICVK
jgi:hypothetical protein